MVQIVRTRFVASTVGDQS